MADRSAGTIVLPCAKGYAKESRRLVVGKGDFLLSFPQILGDEISLVLGYLE